MNPKEYKKEKFEEKHEKKALERFFLKGRIFLLSLKAVKTRSKKIGTKNSTNIGRSGHHGGNDGK